MPAKNTARGRPKGSGLNDHGQLVAIAALIAENPDLKPTTAIKSLGVSDPSTIRRLRDKYRKFQNEADTSAAPTKTNSAAKPKLDSQPKKSSTSAARAKALTKTKTTTPKFKTSRHPRSPKPLPTSASETSLGEPASWLNSWAALGLQTLATSIDVQIAAFRNVVALPHVAFALKQQSTLNAFTVALYTKQHDATAAL